MFLFLFSVALFAFVAALIVGLFQTIREDNARTAEIRARLTREGKDTSHLDRPRHWWFFHKIFGVHFVICRWVGNCFRPAFVIQWNGFHRPSRLANRLRRNLAAGKVKADSVERIQAQLADPTNYCHRLTFLPIVTITVRTRNLTETTVHVRLSGVDFNSEHLACRFGEFRDTDFGGYRQWDVPTFLRPLFGRSHMQM